MKDKLSCLRLWNSPFQISQPGDNDLGSLATPGLWPSDYTANQVAVFPWYQQEKKVTCLPHLCQAASLACHGRGERREDPRTREPTQAMLLCLQRHMSCSPTDTH